ncbi:MAG TPA: RagB/SusD family nutrient uptake outer membrane protein [Flavihumibacter sp.]
MKNLIKSTLSIAVLSATLLGSCAKKLDLFPTNDLTPQTAYATKEGYKSVLAKIYGGMASTGNQGPAGQSDIQGLDEGSQSPFIRGFFNHQELPTDEAVVSWNDQTIQDFHALRWNAADPFILGMYARPVYNITISNEYLREATDDKLASRGISGADADEIRSTRAEVRFLRAFNYWVMLDLFGKSTFITEEDQIGTNLPREINRTDLFNYIESELKALENEMRPARSIEYGRVDQGAAWALLARLYLNAEVYTGTPRYADALTYAKKVIDAGYELHPDYRQVFMADNDKAASEFMYVITCDGLRTQSYGNTTFFVHAASGDNFADYGVNGGWYGYRATTALTDKFEDLSGNTDQRALFTNMASASIQDMSNFAQGVWVKKWVNIRSDGQPVSDVNKEFADIDFPVFRLPEMILIYAEAHLRGGGGDLNTAVEQMNRIRFRAYGQSFGPGNIGRIIPGDLTLSFILDERARELYWEGHRRTDLIRYNLLTTGTYLWPWKGGTSSGTAVDSKYNLYPIPATNRTANPNLSQNPGY